MNQLPEINQAECREYIDLYTTYQGRAERAEAEVARLQHALHDWQTRGLAIIESVGSKELELQRLRAELAEWEVENGMNRTFIRQEMGRLRAEADQMQELLANAVLLMRAGSDLYKRTLAALSPQPR